jgi:hypothetical protein
LRSALLAAIGVLLLVPLVLYAMAQGFTHAMAHRYAVITTLGVGLTAAWLGEGLPSRRRWLRWTVMGALWVAALVHVGAMAWRPGIEEVDTASLHRLIHGHEEMAVDSPKLYLRLSRELAPEDFAKLVYLEDATRAIERMGFDTDELALQRIQPLAGLRLRPFEPTVARAKSLTLLTGRSRGWLRDELKGRGYRLREVESAGPYIVWKAVPQRP